MKLKPLIGALATVLVVGCASAPQTEQEKAVQNAIDDLPKWMVELPVPEDNNKELFVAGTGLSTNLTLARDKATLDVEKQLANKISAKVSSRFKQYVREVGAGTPLTIQDNEQVVKKLVTEANVAGYHQIDSKIVREGTSFRVYMLARYPIEENTLRAIAQTERLINKFKGDKDKAFKELDAEINANRESNGEVPTDYEQHDPNHSTENNVKVYPNGIKETVIVDNSTGTETYPL